MRGRRHFHLNSIIHWIALLELALIFILLGNMLKTKEPVVQAKKGPDPTHALRLELEACVNASSKVAEVAPQLSGSCNAPFLRACAQKMWAYESPLSTVPQSRAALQRFARIPDGVIDWDVPAQLALWDKLKRWKPAYDMHSPFHENGMIPIEDDYVMYAMTMTFEPRTVLEIGSGHSTKTVHNAMLQLPPGHHDAPRQHICIEPYRTQVIDTSQEGAIPIRIIKSIVQEVDPAEFAALQKNDILFIDSSHVIKAFGDTILELVFILPLLPAGVIVHIHDICLPENYPKEWLGSEGSQAEYTEQFMVAAFLYGNTKWRVLWANWMMAMDHPELFRNIGLPGERHGSIWLVRTEEP